MTTRRSSLPTFRMMRQLIKAAPGWYAANVFLWTSIWVLPVIPALITQRFFDDLGTVGFNPATLILDNMHQEDPWAEEEEVWVDFHLNQISATENGRILIAAEAGNIYRSDDGGRSWLSLPSPYEGSFYGSLSLGYGKVLLFGLRGHLFLSNNTGNSWTPLVSNTQATLNDGVRLRDGRIDSDEVRQ